MSDYIDRQAALDGLNEQIAYCDKALGSFEISMKDEYAVKVERASLIAYKGQLESIPATDVVPVAHAYWIPQKENYEFKEAWMKCSACGYPVSKWTGNTNFCPNCGAKMDGGDEHG